MIAASTLRRMPALSLVAALVVIGGLTACGSDDDDDSASSSGSTTDTASTSLTAPSTLVEDGKFSACMDISFPPFESYPAGETTNPEGFDVTVIKDIAERWGVTPEFQQTAFDGLFPALSGGRCDVVWSAVFVLPERTKTFPAIPYFDSHNVLLVAEGNPENITSPESLAGKTVATEKGTDYPSRLAKISDELVSAGQEPITVQTYPGDSDAVQQLVVGRADAVMTQDISADTRTEQTSGAVEVGYTFPSSDIFGVYYPKDNTELGDAIYQALLTLQDDGALAEAATDAGIPESGINIRPPIGQ